MAIPPQPKPPRVSANDLALYMVSSETAKLGIIKRSKYPQTSVIIRYKDARSAVCAYLSDPLRSVNPLVAAETMLQQKKSDMSQSPLMRDDAEHSSDVLKAVQSMANKLKSYDFQKPPAKQPKPILSGLEVSVYADLLVHGQRKGEEEIGAADQPPMGGPS